MRTRYRAIARVVKTHGRRGEVVTVPVHGLPPIMDEGMLVHPVPPALKGPRAFVVDELDEGTAGDLVHFEGVDDIAAAKELVGRTLLVSEEDLPEGFSLYDREALLGRDVRDRTHGHVGSISEVIMTPAHDVWVCVGEYGEVLVPVVEEIVLDVPDSGPIEVDLPVGLVEGA